MLITVRLLYLTNDMAKLHQFFGHADCSCEFVHLLQCCNTLYTSGFVYAVMLHIMVCHVFPSDETADSNQILLNKKTKCSSWIAAIYD